VGQQGLSRFAMDLQKVPMSEVVYARIYGSAETLDREVLPVINQFISECHAADDISKWFFIRYGEGGWHIRLRLFAKEKKYLAVIDRLITVLNSLQCEEKVSKFDFAQYEREIVRYGGIDCIDANEELFSIDSSLYMDLLAAEDITHHDAPRWMIGLILIDCLLRDFGFTTSQKLAVIAPMAESFKAEFSLSGKQSEALGMEYRKNAKLLTELLKQDDGMPAWAKNVIDKAALVSTYRQQVCRQLISSPSSIDRRERDILEGQIHMLCNRLFHIDGREHEVLLYDFMARAYRTLSSLESLIH
jgi:thiopeptide-type bacteriocin biosynthesis protein